MDVQCFLKEKDLLSRDLAEYKSKINDKYGDLVRKFISDNCELEKYKVYEVVYSDSELPKRMSRFVVYDFDIKIIDREVGEHVIIRVGGWWLNKGNTPSKWSTYVVFGSVNNTVFKLSDNQENNQHPDAGKVKA